MDVAGSRKRPRPEEEEPERDMEFWYEDGSIVLIAGNVAFRVYQGLLSQQSSVFADLFAIPRPADAESIDGCPVVRLSDSPEDLRYLLCAIFKNENFLPTSDYVVYFNEVSSLTRLGHKYDMGGVQESALALLKERFTDNFESWDVEEEEKPLHISDTQVIGAVNIARLLGEDSILPSALYTCCQLGPAIMDGYEHEDGSVEYLTTEDIKRCLRAMKELSNASAAFTFHMWFGTRVSDSCTNRTSCEDVLLCYRAEIEESPAAVATCDSLESWRNRIEEAPFCEHCEGMLKDRDVEERRELWGRLANIMDVDVDWK